MSIHRSLKLKNTLARSRNVFRRVERLEILEKDGRREKDDSVFGLPKVRTRFKVAGKKKGKPEADAAASEGAEATGEEKSES